MRAAVYTISYGECTRHPSLMQIISCRVYSSSEYKGLKKRLEVHKMATITNLNYNDSCCIPSEFPTAAHTIFSQMLFPVLKFLLRILRSSVSLSPPKQVTKGNQSIFASKYTRVGPPLLCNKRKTIWVPPVPHSFECSRLVAHEVLPHVADYYKYTLLLGWV